MMRKLVLAVAGVLLLAACGSDEPSPGAGAGSQRAVRFEDFCARRDLSAALRQTVVVIDERAVRQAAPAEMRTVNAALFELVTGLGDPAASLPSGAMAPRERLSLYVAPADGAAPRLIFTGCLPGMSAGERASSRAGRSTAGNMTSDFFGSGVAKEVDEAATRFQQAVLAAVVRTGAAPRSGGLRAGAFEQGSLLTSLKATRQLAPAEGGVPRIFIFTDLAIFPAALDRPAAREAGLSAARASDLSLGGAEVYLIGSSGPPPGSARDYADAFFLGSQGAVMSWGGVAFNALAAAPVDVRAYSGEIVYPTDRFPARLIVGRDAENRLVNSWLITRTDGEWATPISGNLTCRDDVCRLVSDEGGLGQVWSLDPDPEPEFDRMLPLGGMRDIEAEVTPDRAVGVVSDPLIHGFDGAPGVRTLTFDLAAQ